jgi:hypothetical protein
MRMDEDTLSLLALLRLLDMGEEADVEEDGPTDQDLMRIEAANSGPG